MRRISRWSCLPLVLCLFGSLVCGGAWVEAANVPAPGEFLGHAVGADYQLARYEKVAEYFRLVADNSDRVELRVLGETTEGLPLVMAEISAPETIRQLERHREAQRLLADPRLIDGARTERRLVERSKPVVLINCNLHSSEIASSQMAVELLHDLATDNSPRIREILGGTIVLLIPSANPDGLNKVIDWYETTRDKPWEGTGMPWLYQKYAGHDNNRDWFMLALKETQLITRVLYKEWFPTIVYDIHQMGNSNARLFVPPFHDPKNSNVHPLIDQSLLIIGGHMAEELARQGKRGVVHGAMYDNWWAGGFRTTPYRHNMVGILTEAASPLVATPIFQRKSELRGASRGLPSYTMTTNFPDPWPGGWWRLRDVCDYEKICCLSLATLAARYHEMFQGNYLRMGREAIRRGQSEPPFAWIVPANQRDGGAAHKMLEVLHATGIEVCRADKPFAADGTEYPAGSHILYCAQPYRAHLNDMMERQQYPDRRRYPGGPAEPPYDIAGWTLPLQMGVRHVEAALPFEAEAQKLDEIGAKEATIGGADDAAHYWIAGGTLDGHRLFNRLAAAGIECSVVVQDSPSLPDGDGKALPVGSLLVHDGAALRRRRDKLLAGLSLSVGAAQAVDPKKHRELRPVRAPRTALYQSWTGSMDEGWTRLVLENFEFPYTTVHNARIRAGGLGDEFDCLILPSMTTRSILDGQAPDTTAPEYVGGLGDVGVAALQRFVESGGTLVAIDDACNLPIDHFGIPVKNLVRGKRSEDFYCPGSVLRIVVDSRHAVGWGLPGSMSAYFTGSQAFEVTTGGKAAFGPATRVQATVVARYADTLLLESGWIRGEEVIAGKPAIVEVEYGDGRIVLLGFRVQHRAQPHGTFPLLFNAILSSTVR